MTKKLLVAGGIVGAVLIIVLAGLTIFVKSYLTSEKLKSLLIPKVEALTGRKVAVGEIGASLFKGIVVKGIVIKERDGGTDFVTAEAFVLDYDLLPLLRKQLVIKKIEIISPRLLIRRDRQGSYNFRDFMKGAAETKEPSRGEEGKEKGLPFTLMADKILVRDALLDFRDDRKEFPDVTAKADMEIALAMGKSLKDAEASGFLDLREMKATLNGVQTTTSGKIEAKKDSMQIRLDTVIGKDTIRWTGTVKDYQASPDVKLDVHAKELDLDKLMTLGSPEKRVAEGTREKGGAPQKKSMQETGTSRQAKASGEIRIASARYKGYQIRDLQAAYAYKGGAATIEPFRLRLAGGDRVNAEGLLNGNFSFRYDHDIPDAAAQMKRTLSGKGAIDLSRCEVKQSGIADAIAVLTGLQELRTPRFDSARFDYTIRDQKLYLQGNMTSNHIRVNPQGAIDFDQRIDVTADMRLSPTLSGRLPAGKITAYFKDDQGWTSIPLKITGTTEKPSVSLNPAAMGKQIERGIKEAIEQKLFKETPSKRDGQKPSQQQKPEDLLKGILGR